MFARSGLLRLYGNPTLRAPVTLKIDEVPLRSVRVKCLRWYRTLEVTNSVYTKKGMICRREKDSFETDHEIMYESDRE